MTVGTLTLVIISTLTTLAALATVMTWLGFSINGRKHAARIWAWLRKPRTEGEALERRISELEEHIALLQTIVLKESEAAVAGREELAQLVADLKQRADAAGKHLDDLASNIVHDAQELDALGTKQKQVETQLESQTQALETAQGEIVEVRRMILTTLRASAINHDALDNRVRKLEGLPPVGHTDKPPVSDTHDPGSAES